MKRNMTFLVSGELLAATRIASIKTKHKSMSDYCRRALVNQLHKDGFLDNDGDVLKGVIPSKKEEKTSG